MGKSSRRREVRRSHEAGDVLNVSLLLVVIWCDGGMVRCARPCGIRPVYV